MADWYVVLIEAMRYWFALLGIIIAWRALHWLQLEAGHRKRVLRDLPDAGYIGTLHVLEGESRAMRPGLSVPLSSEGAIGSASGCDVRIPHPTVAGRHALFEFQRDGLHLRPHRDAMLHVDGQQLPPRSEAILQHGAVIVLGSVRLQLRLFAGIDREIVRLPEEERAEQMESAASARPKAPPPPVYTRQVTGNTLPFSVLDQREGDYEAYQEPPAPYEAYDGMPEDPAEAWEEDWEDDSMYAAPPPAKPKRRKLFQRRR